ncbi:MAG TPA: hypothetical protein VGI39_39775 [Polyangiaceae bacterium]
MAVYPWSFRQLSPPGGIFLLSGPNAPFGRPRHGAVGQEEVELRDSETYYPGNPVPDRHIFGHKQAPIELSGRFMDSRIGTDGGARAIAQTLKAYVRAAIPVHAEWGPILSFTGLLHKLRLAHESDGEIAWTLTIKVDTDDSMPAAGPIATPKAASALAQQVATRFDGINANVAAMPADIEYSPTFLDSIASLVSSIDSYLSVVSQFAQSVDNFESALASDVAHLRGALAQAIGATTQLQITLDSGEGDALATKAWATSQVEWFSQRAEMEEALLLMVGDLAALDLQAEIAQQGTPDRTYLVSGGDTWESIALTTLGSSEKARALQDANRARYGMQPFVGQRLHVPKAA